MVHGQRKHNTCHHPCHEAHQYAMVPRPVWRKTWYVPRCHDHCHGAWPWSNTPWGMPSPMPWHVAWPLPRPVPRNVTLVMVTIHILHATVHAIRHVAAIMRMPGRMTLCMPPSPMSWWPKYTWCVARGCARMSYTVWATHMPLSVSSHVPPPVQITRATTHAMVPWPARRHLMRATNHATTVWRVTTPAKTCDECHNHGQNKDT